MLDLVTGDKLWETIIIVAIILAVVLILVALIKYPHAKTYVLVLFCIVWTFGGAFCGFTCINYYQKESTTIGDIEVHDPYEDFNVFEYNLGNIVWYENGDGTYSYNTSYNISYEFDGTDKNYEILINNSPCSNTQSTAGQIHGDYRMIFYSVEGEQIDEIELDISLIFYTSHIDITVDSDATVDSIGLLQEYVAINGFEIRIIEPEISVVIQEGK